MWIARMITPEGAVFVDADEDQTDLLRRLTDKYGYEVAMKLEITKTPGSNSPSLYALQ